MGAQISTHALTWRATGAARGGERQAVHFYPRPHMEGDMAGMPKTMRSR